MPLTPAEKMIRYRLKLKENEEMQNKVKENDRKRKANERAHMNEKKLRHHQKANWAAVERHRATKKSKKTTTPIKIFKIPQSLGKARNHVRKLLLQSPCHKKNFPFL